MNKKRILIILASVLIVCLISLSVFALTLGEKPMAILKYIVGITDEMPANADANGDGEVNVLDVIHLLNNDSVDLYDAEGITRLKSSDVIEVQEGKSYAFVAQATSSSAADLTWTTSDNTIAMVDANGKITALNPGECKVSVKTPSGEMASVGVAVYETVAEKVRYRWDFNDLTDSVGGNDLTLASLAKAENACKNYTLSNGIYTVSTTAASTERPYFNFETPIELDNLHCWTIEFRGYVYRGGNLFFGQDPTEPLSTVEEDGFMYVSPTTNWGTPEAPSYRIKFRVDGKNIYFELGEHKTKFLDWATWKIEFDSINKKFTLSVSTDEGTTWETVQSVSYSSAFHTTLKSIFGASRGDGTYNFNGEMDYVEVNCYKNTKVTNKAHLDVTYRWDFNDLTETYNGNDLTLNANATGAAATNYTISDGTYKVKSGAAELERPDFTMKTPFTLSSTQDWAVQWKGNFSKTGTVIGQNGADPTLAKDTGGHIYISPTANWKDPDPITYAVKFKYTSSANVVFPFTKYQSVMMSMSTWRIEYEADTKIATLSFSKDDGATWTVTSYTTMPNFSTQFSQVFGRTLQNGKYNFNSEMDYIQISLGNTGTDRVYLNDMTLDDNNYELSFNKAKYEYTVELPAGRPAVPRIKAEAKDGYTVEIQQAYIPDGKKSGTAKVVVTNGSGKSATYTVYFVKNESNGFVLQYDDRYTFVPNYELKDGESFTFESSDSNFATVDANGVVTAKKLTNTPVTITAKVGDASVGTLVIDRIERAHINLFFITGQSNGQGCYDTVNYDGTTETEGNEWMIPYADQLALVEKIGGEGRVYSYDVHPRNENIKAGLPEAYTLYDMQNYAKQGHSAPIGKAYYDLTGEKVIFLQSAWSGAPIESWLDPDRYEEAGGYGIATRNFYQTTRDGYNKLIPLISANYEIVLTANFWCQGETAMSSYYDKSISNYIFSSNASYDVSNLITDEKYYEYFMRIDKDMREDYGLDFNGIMFTKTKGAELDTTIVPIVSAYFSLVNNNEGVFTATRKFIEIATQYKTGDPTKEGYGFMGTDGVRGNHYNQIGYNYHGKEAANNLFGVVYNKFEAASSIEIIDNDGITRLGPSNTIELSATSTYRLGALPLPHYVDENITWTSSNEYVATVNEFGVVKAISAGNAVITATTSSGRSQSINVTVYETVANKVSYRWDFNDLTDSVGGNDLIHNAGTYTLNNGIYKEISDSDTYTRGQFAFETPIELTSTMDWAIEWKGYIVGGSTFMGRLTGDPTSTAETAGHIYCSPYANWGSTASPKYAIKILPTKGNQILLVYTEHKAAMTEMNCWRMEYSAETNMIKLFLSYDDGATWNDVSTTKAGEFSMYFDGLFGRTRQNGQYNFNGEMDYFKVDCYRFEKVTSSNTIPATYRWDFNDLTDSIGGNDLTLNPALPEVSKTRYSFIDGVYTVNKSTTKDLERPDFIMEEPFTIDSTKNWQIEWKGVFYWAGTLFGQNPETTTEQVEVASKGFLYIPPSASTNWGSDTNVVHAMKFFPSGAANYVLLPFTGYQPYMTSVNYWRVSYDKDTRMISVLVSPNGGVWEVCSQTPMNSEFATTFNNLFGRSFDNGKYNFIGEMDYVEVSLEK